MIDRRDLAAVAVAVAAWCGAAGPVRPPAWLAAILVVGALVRRRPIWVLLAVVGVVGLLAGRAEAGLVPPPSEPFEGEVTLVEDPEARPGRVVVDVRTDGRRLELSASGGAGGALRRASAGDRLVVAGRLGAVSGAPGHLRSRHVGGALVADRIEPGGPTSPLAATANAVRARVRRGAEGLPDAQAALLAGLVFGDDRELPPAEEHDLRAAGLAHLTAVSGQNVAFLLVLAAPLLARLDLPGRFLVVAVLLGFFVVLTRAEPSVLRAATMALVATAGTTFGRPVAGLRLLALAVTALVVVDPLLVDALGFRLSVAASAGILVGAAPLASLLPGPSWCTTPLAVTAAAQLGVSPLLVASGLPVPVVALAANPIAGPAAGWTMAWGLTAGWVAGFVPPWAATVLHLPTRASTGIVLTTARLAAGAPAGSFGAGHLAVLAVGVLVAVAARRVGRDGRDGPDGLDGLDGGDGRDGRARGATGEAREAPDGGDGGGAGEGSPTDDVTVPADGRDRARRWTGVLGVAVALAAVGVAAVPEPASPGHHRVASGAEVVVGPGRVVLVVDGRADPLRVLDGLTVRGVRHLDLVVVRSPGVRAAGTVRVVASRLPAPVRLVPPGAVTPGRIVTGPEAVSVGSSVVRIRPGPGGLEVAVQPAGSRPSGLR